MSGEMVALARPGAVPQRPARPPSPLPDGPLPVASIVEALRHRARHEGDALCHAHLPAGEGAMERMSYGDLDRRAARLAHRLAERLRPGDRAVLVLQPGFDYIAALFGCFYAGVVAVPTFPPRARRLTDTLAAIARDCGAAAILTDRRTCDIVTEHARADGFLGALPQIVLGGAAEDAGGPAWTAAAPDAAALAVLQYTSGSTGRPKGVMLTHGNLVANLEQQSRRFGVGRGGRLVTWLPPFHDMGLVAGILQSPYSALTTLVLSPLHVTQRPLRWLRAIDAFRATVSGGPPFGFDLCLEAATDEDIAALDLSSWECAFVGAEPISDDLLQRFKRRFGPCGFRAEAFAPCYGMAETTLMITGRLVGTGDQRSEAEAVAAIGRPTCGHVMDGHDVRIVDPETRAPLPDGAEGEIWAAGPSIAQGYWGDPARTQADFGACLADGTGPWLRTGDLGVMEPDGELTVTGRIKDLIIVAGRNLHPEDIEATVRGIEDERMRRGAIAAFGADIDGRERVVLAVELRRRPGPAEDLSGLRMAITAAVARGFAVTVHEVVFLGPGEIPRTSSGKLRRHQCARDYAARRNAGAELVS